MLTSNSPVPGSSGAGLSPWLDRWGWVLELALWAVLFSLPFKHHTRLFREGGLFLAAGILFWSRWVRRERSSGLDGFALAWVGLFGAALISAIFAIERRLPGPSRHPYYSYEALWTQLVHFFLIFWVTLHVMRRPGALARGVTVFFASGVLAAALGIAGFCFWGWQKYGRAEGLLESYSRSAMYFIFWFPIVLGLLDAPRWRRWPLRVFWLAGLTVAVWFLALTQTRGAWIAAALGMTGVLVWRRRWILLATMILLLGLVALTPPVRARLGTLTRPTADLDQTLSGRLVIWEKGLKAIAARPIVGIGYGPNVFQKSRTRGAFDISNQKDQPDLHNVYLQQMAETGLLGIASYLFFAFVFIRRVMRAGPPSEPHEPALLPGFWLALVMILVYGIIGNFYEDRIGMLTWWTVGVLSALSPKRTLKDR